jgi:hypothetical protein
LSGGSFTEWVVDILSTERTFLANPTSFYRLEERRFSFMAVFGIATKLLLVV